MIRQTIKKLLGKHSFNSLNYWEKRYAEGGNSGDGSYGRLSEFKAQLLNRFLKENNIDSLNDLIQSDLGKKGS